MLESMEKDTVGQFDVVLEDGVPFFQDNFITAGSSLGGYQLFQIADGVVRITLHSYLFA